MKRGHDSMKINEDRTHDLLIYITSFVFDYVKPLTSLTCMKRASKRTSSPDGASISVVRSWSKPGPERLYITRVYCRSTREKLACPIVGRASLRT